MYSLNDRMNKKINDQFTTLSSQIQSIGNRTSKNENDIENILKTLKEIQRQIQDKADSSTVEKQQDNLLKKIQKLEK